MAKYVPELNHWFANWWKERGDITIHHISTADQPDITYESGSFLELLFRETFPYQTYHFGFQNVQVGTLPTAIVDRLCVKRLIPSVYLSDSTVGVGDSTAFWSDSTSFLVDETSQYNVFSISTDDVQMLDMLFRYRNGFMPDFDIVEYNDLSTNLSKLIYIYLEVMIMVERGHLDDLNNMNNLSLLDEMFLIYVANECHRLIKNTDFLLSSGQVELSPVRLRYNIENFSNITIIPPLPYDLETIEAHLNGIRLNNTDYSLSMDGTNVIYAWTNACHKLYTDHNFLILDYLYLVNAGMMTGYDSTCIGDGTAITVIGIAPEPGDMVI